jgi:hypothetical protein
MVWGRVICDFFILARPLRQVCVCVRAFGTQGHNISAKQDNCLSSLVVCFASHCALVSMRDCLASFKNREDWTSLNLFFSGPGNTNRPVKENCKNHKYMRVGKFLTVFFSQKFPGAKSQVFVIFIVFRNHVFVLEGPDKIVKIRTHKNRQA